ncbi:MAG: polysaccharide biosynthesis/export family protein, partial [Hyphomicrobiaceae bacterium]
GWGAPQGWAASTTPSVNHVEGSSAQDLEGSSAQDLSVTQPGQFMGTGAGTVDETERLGVGDRLKVSFFERPDLSGEFDIRDDGSISLPLLGAIRAAGLNIGQIEQRIIRAFEQALSTNTYVNVHVIERRPVYVVGFVNNPGAYRYQPGMTILNVIALSGGIYRAPATAVGNADISREVAELKRSTEELKRQLARQARLRAELAGKSKTGPPPRLAEIAEPREIASLTAAENRLMVQRANALRDRTKGYAHTIELLNQEIAAMQGQLTKLADQIALTQTEKAKLSELRRQGLLNGTRMLEISRSIALLEGESRQLTAAIRRVQRELVTAEQDKALLTTNQRIEIGRELSAVEDEITASRLTIEKSRTVIQELGGHASRVAGVNLEPKVAFRIIRRTHGKNLEINGNETMRIHSGDVLRVSRLPDPR